tara:strand:+ start:1480 stop:1716 length:237 start_codon:yes stop_codon:yes gene_type:complete
MNTLKKDFLNIVIWLEIGLKCYRKLVFRQECDIPLYCEDMTRMVSESSGKILPGGRSSEMAQPATHKLTYSCNLESSL